jgi:hypothetical protein
MYPKRQLRPVTESHVLKLFHSIHDAQVPDKANFQSQSVLWQGGRPVSLLVEELSQRIFDSQSDELRLMLAYPTTFFDKFSLDY